ncbi:MAG: long-chain fatty acid--CoA ligase [Chloroflexi bacterium AL-W]|nr:long-chain fatty acid--CoA ligase [Chloroflexi bacterium AL-N1]NOK69176.1 long-chain fatty acid--CoA ligase [Chloroflexi bacterium AL-N10]NOK77159.1 long-chain fatty acid--CoA ligase [Chloroflexi bacterium AL-N5]NOK83804.1 long-chain fatty acid--CoA ligase [Chloroflexi bacterium AL-W]NOK91014.1 long-chain fatty acid--CoA ligase [Chloroflexi bacterium AL-N15]
MENVWLNNYEAGVSATLSYPDSTLSDFLAESARKYPYNTATHFVLSYLLGGRYTVGGKITYRKLNELVDRFATSLHQLGVRKGDRVALMLPNSPHFVIAFFAAMRLGAIIVNNNPTYTSRELKHQLSDSGSETIVILNLFWPRLREIQQETPIKRVIVAHVFDTLSFPSSLLVKAKQRRDPEWVDVPRDSDILFFQNLLDQSAPTPPSVEIKPDDTALFQYTGGTTGLPKAATLTHRNLVANTIQVSSWLTDGKPGQEKVMAAIPFFHVYGMTVCMIYGLYMGAELVIVPNPRPIDNVMGIIQHERATVFPGVPAMYIGIVNHPEINSYDLTSVRACISGSAPLPMDIQERFGQITGGRLVEGYGLTEAAPVTHCNPVYGKRKNGSIGVPFPDVEVRLIDLEKGEDLPLGSEQEGELLLKGPQVMKGYWNQPEETAATIDADGWLHTGDICKTDEDGYFFIVDRKKDMINVSGLKVLPRDVEEVLFMHPKVLEAVVAGIPHPTRGDDTVKAFIVRQPGEQVTVEEIREFCKLHLAPYKIPREIEFRDELPKTIVGKVLRRVLVEEEKQKQVGQTAASEPTSQATAAEASSN